MTRIVIIGGGPSGLLLGQLLHRAGIDAVVLANPWVIEQADDLPPAAAIRARFGLPVMKAIGVATPSDLARAADYAGAADMILFDAKPPRDAVLPGGNGRAFDWTILHAVAPGPRWMLSGGLDAGNVAEALRVTGAGAVDVSSGVESAPGVKDPQRIRDFIAAARGVSPQGRSG